jgi:hypothetical protein
MACAGGGGGLGVFSSRTLVAEVHQLLKFFPAFFQLFDARLLLLHLPVQLLDGRGGMDGQRMDVHLENLTAVSQFVAAGFHVIGEDLLKKWPASPVKRKPVGSCRVQGASGMRLPSTCTRLMSV